MMTAMSTPALRPVVAVALAVVTCLTLASCNKAPADAAASSSAATSAAATQGPDLLTDPSSDPAKPATDATTPAAPDTATPADATTAPGATPTGAAGQKTACALITQAEAATALGADPGPGEATAAAPATSCLYGQSPSLVTVNLIPINGKATLGHMTAQAPAGTLTSIPGVGDSAFTFAAGPSASVWFVKGDAMVAIGVIASAAPGTSSARALTLAKLAAGRL
ncbi:MAG: hypothetical protein QOG52_1734 [Frankiaceae bacterium]|jgi:hypothetical protein|nr:hypothetical protein [Frankiaceae bacterium]